MRKEVGAIPYTLRVVSMHWCSSFLKWSSLKVLFQIPHFCRLLLPRSLGGFRKTQTSMIVKFIVRLDVCPWTSCAKAGSASVVKGRGDVVLLLYTTRRILEAPVLAASFLFILLVLLKIFVFLFRLSSSLFFGPLLGLFHGAIFDFLDFSCIEVAPAFGRVDCWILVPGRYNVKDPLVLGDRTVLLLPGQTSSAQSEPCCPHTECSDSGRALMPLPRFLLLFSLFVLRLRVSFVVAVGSPGCCIR